MSLVNYDDIPETTMGALLRYAEFGHRPGGFLQAVLDNDLFLACGYADPENMAALRSIVSFVKYQLPALKHQFDAQRAISGDAA